MKKVLFVFTLTFGTTFIFSQNIQFPESFKLDNSFFIEPLLNPLPNNSQTAGFKGNPGLITDTLVLKRLQSDYAEIGMEAIYYQYYGNADKATSALHVVKYRTVEDRVNAMRKLTASSSSAYLFSDVYLIIINILHEKDRDEQFDRIIEFYQQKLGATLFLERKKYDEVRRAEITTVEAPKNRTDYQKLSEKDIKRFFKLETKTHRLGRVSFDTYLPEKNTFIETTYEVKDNKLIFYWENIYKYDDKDSLVYESQYSEIPTAEYPEFREDKYACYKDYCLKTRSFNGKIQDSVFTYFDRNENNRIESEMEVKMTSSGNFKFPRDKINTVYTYDKQGNITSKKITAERYQKEYRYEYENGNLKKKSFIADHYISEEIYDENGKLIEGLTSYPQSSDDLYRALFIYNKKGWLVKKENYKNDKLTSTYKYINDKKGREIKNHEGKESGIYLYEYDDQDREKYKIELYFRDEKPIESQTIMTMPALVNNE